VVQAGAQAVLLDTATGKTWLLQPGGDGRAVWVPARRLDSDKEISAWQKARAAERREQDTEKARIDDLIRDQHERALVEQQRALQAEAETRRALDEAKRRLLELQKKQVPDK
jgi:hypothetical protein